VAPSTPFTQAAVDGVVFTGAEASPRTGTVSFGNQPMTEP
jgi:hypothetical protein